MPKARLFGHFRNGDRAAAIPAVEAWYRRVAGPLAVPRARHDSVRRFVRSPGLLNLHNHDYLRSRAIMMGVSPQVDGVMAVGARRFAELATDGALPPCMISIGPASKVIRGAWLL